ncbi:MAG: hypothetical protein WAT25_10215 [Paracoccaceae bacterium]|nr:hypothetical protein [Rhodobacter sp.]
MLKTAKQSVRATGPKAPLCPPLCHKAARLGGETVAQGERRRQTMAKAMDILRKLNVFRGKEPEGQTVFDNRLQKMGGVRQGSVARAVLFRTERSHSAA